MASLNMEGPYELTDYEVSSIENKIGNYALGYESKGEFYVRYVGRSDNDLNGRLKNWLNDKPSNYAHFKYSYATSVREAFLKECRNYHDFGENKKLDNISHPDQPNGTNWKCPVCEE